MSSRACRVAVVLLAVGVLAAGVAAPAAAQNRLSAEAGGLFPFGDFADANSTSLYIGARFEFQDVNALGAVAVVSYLLRAGYAPLAVDSDRKSLLESVGESTSSHLFNAGGGLRVYSTKSPLFMSFGVEYLNLDLPGDIESKNGVNLNLGAGLTWGRESIILEAEVRGHVAFLEDIDNIQYMIVQGNIGIPF